MIGHVWLEGVFKPDCWKNLDLRNQFQFPASVSHLWSGFYISQQPECFLLYFGSDRIHLTIVEGFVESNP